MKTVSAFHGALPFQNFLGLSSYSVTLLPQKKTARLRPLQSIKQKKTFGIRMARHSLSPIKRKTVPWQTRLCRRQGKYLWISKTFP